MNKYLVSLTIATTVLFSTQVTANSAFAKLTPSIVKNATDWVNNSASTLSDDLQLTYLNLLALQSEQSLQPLMRCAQYVELHEEILQSYEEFSTGFMNILKKYIEPIHKKISAKKDLSETEEKTIVEKLQIKIQELLAYINAIYYQTLYNHIAQNNPKSLTYMFDADGVIPQEKRTKMLPQSL